MIKLLIWLFLIACLGLAAGWVAGHPGHVTIHWFDYRIDTSFAFLLLIAVVAVAMLAYLYIILHRLVSAPAHYSTHRNLKAHRKGLTELTYSVAALAAADVKGAEAHTRKAEKLLGRTPLTLLLSAQIARSQGDDVKTRLLLEQMLDHDETEYLAARSLSDAASKQQLFPKALALAKRAHALNPKDIAAVVSLHIRLGEWQEALLSIAKAARKGHLTRNRIRHYKGIAHLEQGMRLIESGQPETAFIASRYAIKELPDFVPAIIFAAKIFAANGQQRKAIKLIFAAYKTSPHPQLAEALRNIIAKEPKEKQVALFKKLDAMHPDPQPTGATWVCSDCGHASPQWQAHCPSCEAFDTLEWK